MAVGKKNLKAHENGMTFDEARLFLQLKWYVEDTIGGEIDIPMFSSIVGMELEKVSAGGRNAISRLHLDYLLMRHAEFGQEVGSSYANEFHKQANNGHAADLYSLKRNVETSGLVESAGELSWREVGAVIFYIINNVRWENTKKMLSKLIREDDANDDGSYEYLY